MNLIELSKYLNDEELAEKYLLEKEILKTWTNCPHCNSDKLGKISRGRIKCYKCKKEWHKRKGSFLESKQISFSKFIAFIKLYADEFGVNQLSKELELDIKSVIMIHSDIRMRLIHCLTKPASSEFPNVILYEENGELILKFTRGKEFQKNKNFYILEFNRYKELGSLYSFLVQAKWCGKNKSHQAFFNSFLSYAKMRLINYRGIKVELATGYLYELILKYNNRDKNYYELIANSLKISRVVDFPVQREF